VLKNDRLAISSLAPHELHFAITGGTYGRAASSGVIDTTMGAQFMEYWVTSAGGEARTDASELHWRPDKGPP